MNKLSVLFFALLGSACGCSGGSGSSVGSTAFMVCNQVVHQARGSDRVFVYGTVARYEYGGAAMTVLAIEDFDQPTTELNRGATLVACGSTGNSNCPAEYAPGTVGILLIDNISTEPAGCGEYTLPNAEYYANAIEGGCLRFAATGVTDENGEAYLGMRTDADWNEEMTLTWGQFLSMLQEVLDVPEEALGDDPPPIDDWYEACEAVVDELVTK